MLHFRSVICSQCGTGELLNLLTELQFLIVLEDSDTPTSFLTCLPLTLPFPLINSFLSLLLSRHLCSAYQVLNIGLDHIGLQAEVGIKATASGPGEPPLYLFDLGQVIHHYYFLY